MITIYNYMFVKNIISCGYIMSDSNNLKLRKNFKNISFVNIFNLVEFRYIIIYLIQPLMRVYYKIYHIPTNLIFLGIFINLLIILRQYTQSTLYLTINKLKIEVKRKQKRKFFSLIIGIR
ncbi:hypothetical protein H311_02762 [Anncaliia algerae PRA109]|nr:hypothetical protein H311_02762 [Anncaliia algerae PRA109]